jgi:hypothetical protein
VSAVYRTHIKPAVDLPWSVITPADCERLRDALDVEVEAGKLGAKTAFNVWAVAAKAAAVQWKKDKRRALKERDERESVGTGNRGAAPSSRR